MIHTLKYINKQLHIQHKINQGKHLMKKVYVKHPWIQLYKHFEKKNKDVKLTSNLHYKEPKIKK